MARTQARIAELNALLGEKEIDLKRLELFCYSGIPDRCQLRSLCWKLLLGYLPRHRSEWEASLKRNRAQYQAFVREFIVDVHKSDPQEEVLVDPLGALSVECGKSSWDTFFKDNEILEQIDKDVHRLCPEFAFYKECSHVPRPPGVRPLHERVARENLDSVTIKDTRSGIPVAVRKPSESSTSSEGDGERHWEVVERILFVYAKLNARFYVQGMNEILGVLYYVFVMDAAPEWLPHTEADAFFCFVAIMATPNFRECFFKNVDDTTAGVGARLVRMQEKLAMHDREVHDVLEAQQVRPQYFAFRWITLLFSQDLSLPDVIRLWDSIFSAKDRIEFVLDVCVAMLTNVRDDIIKGDFSSNVKLLQSYPRDVDIQQLVIKADAVREQEEHFQRHQQFLQL